MAGRKDKNIIDYFPHYCDSGRTMFILESKYKSDGYAAWFKILELLGKCENHYIDCRNDEDFEYMQAKIQLINTSLTDILDLLSKLNAINQELWDKKIIWSPNFIKNIEDVYKRRKNNKCMYFIDLCKHLSIRCKHKYEDYDNYGNIITQSKVEYSKAEESKGDVYRKFDHLRITIEENNKLIGLGYTQDQINVIYDKISNFKQNTKYKSLYLTSLDWLKREFGNKSIKNKPKLAI